MRGTSASVGRKPRTKWPRVPSCCLLRRVLVPLEVRGAADQVVEPADV